MGEEKNAADEEATAARYALDRERTDAEWRVKALTTPLNNRATRSRERHKEQSADLAAELRGILHRVKAVTRGRNAGPTVLSVPTMEDSRPEPPDECFLPIPDMKKSSGAQVSNATDSESKPKRKTVTWLADVERIQ